MPKPKTTKKTEQPGLARYYAQRVSDYVDRNGAYSFVGIFNWVVIVLCFLTAESQMKWANIANTRQAVIVLMAWMTLNFMWIHSKIDEKSLK